MINQETQIAFTRGEEWALEAIIREWANNIVRRQGYPMMNYFSGDKLPLFEASFTQTID